MNIRNVFSQDYAVIEDMNRNAVPAVNEIPQSEFMRFAAMGAVFRVAMYENRIAGFIIAMGPGLDYDSPNYRWFENRYERFLYVDRIVVAPEFARQGIGKGLYADVCECAERIGHPIVTCEVNLKPRNEASLLFHERLGFVQAGQQDTEGGKKTVALLALPLV